jgi:hypothetical protein
MQLMPFALPAPLKTPSQQKAIFVQIKKNTCIASSILGWKKKIVASFHFSSETGERVFSFFFICAYFQKRRGSFITVMYFNHVLKCPIDLKTKFGMRVLE